MSGAIKEVQDRAVEVWGQVDEEISERIRRNLDEHPKMKDVDPNHIWSLK